VPGQPFLCPDCGGGPPGDAIRRPADCIERIQAAGHSVPFWLEVLRARLEIPGAPPAEEIIVPE
jgi:hypothetical protein